VYRYRYVGKSTKTLYVTVPDFADILLLCQLKVLSDENRGGSKLVLSIDPFL
jgi:hypothetical protein